MEPLLTITQLASTIGVRERVIMRFVRKGELPYRTIGKSIRFVPTEVRHWLDTHPEINPAKMSATHPVTIRSQAEPPGTSELPTHIRRGRTRGDLLAGLK
jgi:excisionase family DNA binding protein